MQFMQFSEPALLAAPAIQLEPLRSEHRAPLRLAASLNEDVWTYFPMTFNGAGEDFDPWFDYTLEQKAKRAHFPFAVRRQSDNCIIGTTRYYDMVPVHRRLAIGSTWYIREARGTMVNPEVRLLTLKWAFERLQVNRVELITDPCNLASQAAMKLLGVVREGIIRNHLIYKDGRVRDSILYSIVRAEWPMVQMMLLERLGYTEGDLRLEAAAR